MTARLSSLVIWACTAVAFATAANAFYGFEGNPDNRESWKESYCVRINPMQYEMRQPDGVTRIFGVSSEDPHVLIGDAPWVGEVDGRQILVMTNPDFTGGQTGFLFIRGHLRKMLLDGREIEIGKNDGIREDGFPTVTWPEVTEQMVEEASAKYGVHWHDRFSLWYENPNSAGVLLAELALVALALFAYGRKWVGFLGAILFMAASFGVACTESRSAMIGLGAGVALIALSKAKTFFTLRGFAAFLTAFAVVCLAVWASGAGERFTTGMFHEGADQISRLPIWVQVPRMIVASPDGWGAGNAGTAYMDWFQPLERTHVVSTMISAHFTFLVEHGWCARVVYVMGWFGGLSLLAFSAMRTGNALALAVWMAFFVSCFFNPIGREWSLWVVPAATLLTVSLRRLRVCDYVVSLCFGAIMVGVVFCTIRYLAERTGGVPSVSGAHDYAILNGDHADSWIVRDDFVLAGGYYALAGKDIRSRLAGQHESASIGIAKSIDAVGGDAENVVFAGKSCEDFLRNKDEFLSRHGDIKRIVFLSPPFGWDRCSELSDGECQFLFVAGEYANRFYGGNESAPGWVRIVPGCALYIPDWMNFLP